MSIFNRTKKQTQVKTDLRSLRGVRSVRGDISLGSSEAIYAAITRIANTIAMLPLHLYHGTRIAADDVREKLVSYMPNATMTPYTWKQTMEAYRNTEGSAYALIVRDPGSNQIESLDVLDASRVTPMRELGSKEIWYQIPLDNGQTAVIHSSNLIVLHHLSANGEKGIRPLDVLRGSLTYSDKIKEFSLQQLEGVNSGVILTLPGQSVNSEKRTQLVNAFIQTYKESGGRVMVLEGGVQATTLSQSPVNAAVLDVERITKNRVATVFSIPPHMLGDYSNATYSTAEQAQREFLSMTILPIVRQWVEELNLKMLTWEERQSGWHYGFDLTVLTAGDIETTGNKYQKAVRGGWYKPNEVRELEGMEPAEGGDQLLVARDLIPLSVLVQEAQAALLKALAEARAAGVQEEGAVNGVLQR